MNRTTPRRKAFSRAALQLQLEGCSVLEIAELSGYSQSAVSAALSGTRGVPADVSTALEERLGNDAALRVLAHVPAPNAA